MNAVGAAGGLPPGAGEGKRVSRIRGIVMLIAGIAVLGKGWQIHRGETAALAYGLGVVALALATWHLTRKPPQPRI